MNLKTYLILTLLILSQSGCSLITKEQYLKDESYASQPVKVPYRLVKVVIKDVRKDKNGQDLQVPNIYFKKHDNIADAVLTDERRHMIEGFVTDRFAGTDPVIALVEITTGTQRFTSGLMEKESVDSKIKVTLIDVESNSKFIWATGDAWFEVKSIDASKEYLDKLYDKAVRASLYKALEILATYQAS